MTCCCEVERYVLTIIKRIIIIIIINSAFHPSGVSKARKAEAGMVHSVSG